MAARRKPFILFITGTSASGKTSLFERFKNDPEFSEVLFRDIDENGVPDVGRGPWRRYRVEELLYEAVQDLKDGQSTIISGIVKPYEVIESHNFSPRLNIHFLLLEVSFSQLRDRLKQRIALQTKKGDDETFRKGAWGSLLCGNKELRRVLSNSVSGLKNGYVCDAGSMSMDSMYDYAKETVRRISH